MTQNEQIWERTTQGTCISNLKPSWVVVLENKSKISVLTKIEPKYPPKIQNSRYWHKWTNLRENHPRYLHIKFETILSCGSGEEVENISLDQKLPKIFNKNTKFKILTRNEQIWERTTQGTRISNLRPFWDAVLKKKSKISVLTKNDPKYSPKIQNSRYWHEMNKSEREPPKVLAYQIWNHSELRFWRRSRKYQFLPKMTQNIHKKIQNSRYWHEMNKSDREPPKVLAYQIWNHSELRF